MTEQLHFHFSQWQPTPEFLPGEFQGRGSLVGCLSGVAQSRTRLKQLSSSSSSQSAYFTIPASVSTAVRIKRKHSQVRRDRWFLGGCRSVEGGSVQFSCSVMSDSLQPHGLQHARLPCPSPTLRACSNSCPLTW